MKIARLVSSFPENNTSHMMENITGSLPHIFTARAAGDVNDRGCWEGLLACLAILSRVMTT